LKEIFKEYKVVSAHVVANKYNGRKKGYGFVELETQEEQTKALAVNNTVVEGRKIGVRVAFKEVKQDVIGEKAAEETIVDESKKETKKEGVETK
jgi:RNA recognition motif-containing protein